MTIDTILGLVNNTALLMALIVLYETISLRKTKRSHFLEIFTGVLIGSVGLAIMLTPWRFSEGIIFDTRSILLSMTGLFFGAIPTTIAVLMACALRIYQGGDGAIMGVSVIVTSAGLGLLWRYFLRYKKKTPNWYKLYGFGILVHLVMLGCAFLLPRDVIFNVLEKISLPVMLIYPIGTVLLGQFLLHRHHRVQWQQTLREERDLFELISETSPVGIVMVDRSGQIEYANTHAEQTLGLSRDRITKLRYNAPEWNATNLDGSPLPGEQLPFSLVMNTGKPVINFIHAIVWPDGRRILLSINAAPLLDRDGSTNGMVATIDNITDQVSAEQTLINSEERFRTAFHTSPDSININRLEDGMYIDINDGFTAITGYSREDALGRTSAEINIWDDPKDRQKLVDGLRQNGRVNNLEAKFRMKNGKVITALMSAQVIMLDGAPHILSITRDIEERKKAEAALRRSEALLNTVQEISSVGGWEWNLITNEMYWTDEVYRIHGLAPEDIPVGSTEHIDTSIECYQPDDRPAIQAAFQNCVEQGQSYDQEYAFTDYSGQKKWIRTHGEAVFENGQIVRVVGNLIDITNRKNTEQALQDSKSLYHDLVETAQDLIWQCDSEGRYTYLNPAWEQVFGYKLEEMLGKRFMDFQIPEYAQRDLEQFSKLTEGGFLYGFETTHQHKNGNDIHLVFNAKATLDKDGHITGTRGTAYDITERKQAENLIRENEAKFSSVFNSSPIAYSLMDMDGKLMNTNPAFSHMSGYLREEALGKTTLELNLIGPADRKHIREIADQNGAFKNFEFDLLRRDGTIHPVSLSRTTISINDKPFILGMAIDIAERVRAENEIKRRVESLATLVAVGNRFIASLELEALFQTTTDGLVQLIGMDSSAIYLQENDSLFLWATTPPLPPDFPEIYRKAPIHDHPHIQKAMQAGVPVLIPDLQEADLTPAERQVSEARGLRTVLYLPITIGAESKGILIIGSVGAPRPISQSEIDVCTTLANQAALSIANGQYHQQLKQYAAELEQRVVERTAQLESFAYSVSHDLKAPLRGIHGYSHLLLKHYADQLDDEGKLFIQNVYKAAQNMSQLIDDLLAYSRMERRQIVHREVDIVGIVEALLDEFEHPIKTNAIDVQVQLPCTRLQADVESLVQILRNLIDNAIKFTEYETHPRIEIGGKLEESSCVLWVRDNGIGFEMRYTDRIFEIFQRLHRVDEYPGTGIGLAIVKKAMQRMGGRVWAESEPGMGATFYLEFPRSKS